MATFSPERLKIARMRREVTKRALSEALSVSAQALTGYETGSYEPTKEVVERMSYALQFPVGWFYSPEIELRDPDGITFRARYSMSAKLRDQAYSDSEITTGIISPAFRNKLTLPPLDLPDLSEETPEVAARILREHWQLGRGPIANMVHLLEAKGVEVYWWHKSDSGSLDAASLWRDDKPFVFLNTFKDAGCRGRFDAAHELGHLVLHRSEKVLDSRQVENEANQFASAFLLPAEQFRLECPVTPSLTSFFPLKKRWGVAISAMVRRGRDTGLFSSWQYEVACKDIARRGWRTQEPEIVAIKRETSKLQWMIFQKLAEKGISAEHIAAEINLSWDIFVDAVPVAKEYRYFAPITRTETNAANKSHLRLLPPIKKSEKANLVDEDKTEPMKSLFA